jgi:hypothetical protein
VHLHVHAYRTQRAGIWRVAGAGHRSSHMEERKDRDQAEPPRRLADPADRQTGGSGDPGGLGDRWTWRPGRPSDREAPAIRRTRRPGTRHLVGPGKPGTGDPVDPGCLATRWTRRAGRWIPYAAWRQPRRAQHPVDPATGQIRRPGRPRTGRIERSGGLDYPVRRAFRRTQQLGGPAIGWTRQPGGPATGGPGNGPRYRVDPATHRIPAFRLIWLRAIRRARRPDCPGRSGVPAPGDPAIRRTRAVQRARRPARVGDRADPATEWTRLLGGPGFGWTRVRWTGGRG